MSWKKEGNVIFTYCSRIGTVSFSIFRPNDVLLHDLEAKVKRKGYGTKLVLIAIKKLIKEGITRFLVIPANTTEALKFWKSFGVIKQGSYLVLGKNGSFCALPIRRN